MERIDKITDGYHKTERSSTIEGEESDLFITGPAEFLCKEICAKLLAPETLDGADCPSIWKQIFGENVDPYKRMDYPIRGVPALRVYNNVYTKAFESWFIEGDIIADLIFPASLRRKELEQIPDTVGAALLQQFRREPFFSAICDKVPGLNELGKRFEVDKSLAFVIDDNMLPLTQLTMNFRIDLRQWDLYLESDDRTKENPFVRTLSDLKSIVATIKALRDDNSVELTLGVNVDET